MSKCVKVAMSKSVKTPAPALTVFGLDAMSHKFFVGQLVMRNPAVKDGQATGPFRVESIYKLGRGFRYRIQRMDGPQGAGVAPRIIRAMTSEEERAFHKNTEYKHFKLWI